MADKNLIKIDFSQEAVKKAVTGKIIQNPVSLYSVALGIVGIIAAQTIIPGLLFTIVSAGLIGFGIFMLIINLSLRKDSFETKHLTILNELINKQKQMVLERIRKGLERYSSTEDLKEFSDQAVKQFEMIQKKFDDFKQILSEKFDTAEITYGRFFGTTEQLYLSVLDNLEDIMNSLVSIGNIDDAYIRERLECLDRKESTDDADRRERETLLARKDVKKKTVDRINELLTINEEAQTQIDMSMATISRTKTKTGRASVDMEVARKDLEELINRTKKYSMSK